MTRLWLPFGYLLLIGLTPAAVLGEKTATNQLAGPDFVALVPGGTLVIVGGGKTPAKAREVFVTEARKGTGKLVVIPSAGASSKNKPPAEILRDWSADFPEATILDCATRDDALKPDSARLLEQAQAVWIDGGQQSRLAQLYQGTPVEQGLKNLLRRGGVVGGPSAGAAIMSRVMIASEGKQADAPVMATGLDLLPRVIIDQHFTQRSRKGRLATAVKNNPGLVGMGIDEGTALIINQRLMAAAGTGGVHAIWSLDGKTVREQTWKGGEGENAVDDLPRLWRLAALGEPAPRGKPLLEKGSLVAVGGGGMVPEVVEKFIDLAGGKDALIVVLPTAGEPGDSVREARQAGGFFKRAGATNVKALAGVTRSEVDSDEYVNLLAQAKGVWFGGGRQWRFVDAYEGTKSLEAMRAVLARGGVIGGSSAGATIVGDYLCRGGPLGNREILVPGYDRGLAFLPGVGIDQHFSQRRRFADMEQFIHQQPGYLGIGIDEATALVVTPDTTEVLGPGKVHVYKQGREKKEYAKGEKISLQ